MEDEFDFDPRMLMGDFQAIDEEAQKDLLFVILDGMRFFGDKMDASKTQEERRENYEKYSLHQALASFFLKDKEWMKKAGFSARAFVIGAARRMREEYEKGISKA